MTPWCCDAFMGCFELAGRRGVAVIADKGSDGTPRFFIQFRASDSARPLPPTSELLTAASEVGIVFCPWCGKNLAKFYGRKIEALMRPDLRLPG